MKKLALTLMACLAIGSYAHAATSALTESLLEFEAITSAIGTDPDFENVIGPAEFIFDIHRITRQIDVLGKVKYEILTVEPRSTHLANKTCVICEQNNKTGCGRNNKNRIHKYIAILNVEPNPGIGPNIITVVNIKPINHK